MNKKEKNPVCDRVDCLCNCGGECAALTSTDFKGKPCPFWNPRDEKNQNAEIERLKKRNDELKALVRSLIARNAKVCVL